MTLQQGKSKISVDGRPHLAVFTLAKFPLALLTMLVECKRLSRQGAEGIQWEAFFCAVWISECAFNILRLCTLA